MKAKMLDDEWKNDETYFVKYASAATVKPEPGDTLHVRLGVLDMPDGGAPWIPTFVDLEVAHAHWTSVVPAGVTVIVSHIGETIARLEKKSETE